jgi:predicted 2-oxoglutarate/Fe(II)-dependent dioxygenase YbiX
MSSTVMLSPDDTFDGGEFQVSCGGVEGAPIMETQTFKCGDAVVFPSRKYHCVQPVTGGIRRVLIMELWYGEERDCGHRCEQHWGTCGYSPGIWNRTTGSFIAW